MALAGPPVKLNLCGCVLLSPTVGATLFAQLTLISN